MFCPWLILKNVNIPSDGADVSKLETELKPLKTLNSYNFYELTQFMLKELQGPRILRFSPTEDEYLSQMLTIK